MKDRLKYTKPIVRPQVGDVALCKAGKLGYVQKIVPTTYRGKNRKTWVGVCIDPEFAGSPWQSFAPARVVPKEILNM